MSFLLNLTYSSKINFNTTKDVALKKLGNIEKIAELHPRVKSVKNISENCWQWEMHPSGASGNYFNIIYACSYNQNNVDYIITWNPVKNIGNAVVYGRWEVYEGYAKIYLDIKINIPFLKIFKKLANQIANKIFTISMNKHLRLLEEYINED